MNGPSRRLTALIAVALPLWCIGTFAATASDPQPGVRIGDVRTSDGAVDFTLTGDNLSSTDRLDPASVTVKADQTRLKSSSTADGGTTPGGTTTGGEVRAAVLAIDTSGSMRASGIAGARNAALAYADKLPEDVRVGVVSFAARPHVLLAPTADRARLAPALSQLRAHGRTALYDGILAAVAALHGVAIGRIVVLSDGHDTSSRNSLHDLTTALARDGIPVDVVPFRDGVHDAELGDIVAAGHGRMLPAGNVSELASAFASAATVFAQRLLVHSTVPSSLAGQHADLVVTVQAGARTLTVHTAVSFASAAASSASAAAPANKAHSRALWVACSLTFVAVLAVAVLVLFAPGAAKEKKRKQNRLGEVRRYRSLAADRAGTPDARMAETHRTSGLAGRVLGIADRALRARDWRPKLVADLERAGLRMRAEEWAVLQASAVAVGAAAFVLLFGNILGLPVGALLAWLVVRLIVRIKVRRRETAFEEQLPNTLQLISGSLRSGFSLNQALTGVVREAEEPTAGEFSRALAESRLGAELEDTLDGVAERMRSEDLPLVVMAIRTSREVGGNLGEVLEGIAETMRERAQLRGHVRVLSAEGRLSAKILIALPLLMTGFLLAFRRSYLYPLISTGPGIAMLALGSVLLVIGAVWATRTAKLKV